MLSHKMFEDLTHFPFQVRFLVEQGIDHLVSLSPEKIPPHYAFPDLKHTLIPVEDFTGPTIAEIQKFLEICDCARRDGEVFHTGRQNGKYFPNLKYF